MINDEAMDFFRFPHTPHLAWLGDGSPRDDKVLSPNEVTALLAGDVVVEEKLDGANVGFSLAPDGSLRAQNRGQYLAEPHAGQFARLPAWLAQHGEGLRSVLKPNLIAFGEWCAARHSLDYAALPDWFLLFDVYDRAAGRFWSSTRCNPSSTKMSSSSAMRRTCLRPKRVPWPILRARLWRTTFCCTSRANRSKRSSTDIPTASSNPATARRC